MRISDRRRDQAQRRVDVIRDTVPTTRLAERFPGVEFGANVVVNATATIGPGTQIGAGTCIYPGTTIGRNVAVLENSVLGRPTLTPAAGETVKRVLPDDISPLAIGDDTVIGACVVLYRGSTVGRRCIICDLVSIREQCVIQDDVLLGRAVMIQVNTEIGERTKIMDSCHLPGDMIVGADVFLSTHVCGASENTLGRETAVDAWAGPRIRDRAYIGANATLLPQIEIGEDAVVGAGSVVTRDVPARQLVIGVPARVVRGVEPRLE